uniref:Uncharacterized protein n=1 Tax=Arundo donax TaxID=35708 RepID=A0A0A8YJ46_ARUDO
MSDSAKQQAKLTCGDLSTSCFIFVISSK